MGDLIDLFRQRPEQDREELIDAWLKGRVADEDELEERWMLQELTDRSLQSLEGASGEPIFTMELPDAPKARQRVARRLAPLNPVLAGGHATVDGRAFLRYVQEAYGVPLMQVSLLNRKVTVGIDGHVSSRSEPPPDGTSVDGALQHLEDYMNTADWGRSLNPKFVKTGMFEALLYFLAAPFAHEHMKVRRQTYALVDSRGPQVLYIFGHAQNGKSTFVKFALRLLTGQHTSTRERGRGRGSGLQTAGRQLPNSQLRDIKLQGH